MTRKDADLGVHARQFLIAPAGAPQPQGLQRRLDFAAASIATHAGLSHATARSNTASVVVLGDIFDPRAPAASNADVAARLSRSADMESFELAAHGLAGRWVVLVQIGDSVRLYPDAGGTKSVFYSMGDHGVYAGSQPGLLVAAGATTLDEPLRAAFHAGQHADSWPLGLTPYRGVNQLLPNHYLDLRTGQAVRFWPRENVPARPLDAAAALVLDLIAGSISAAQVRGVVTVPITAGYDSRTIFAAAAHAGLLDHLRFARIRGHHLPFHDTIVPRRIARQFGVRLEEIRTSGCPPAVADTVLGNVGDMWWDRADYMMPAFSRIDTDYLLLGQLSEITRCFYFPNGTAPPCDPQHAARVTRYAGNAAAMPVFERWCESVPLLDDPTWLDLLYWEHRVGTWASVMATGFDTFFTPVFPYCCRELLTALLGVDARHRVAPYELHRRICDIGAQQLLDHEFNDSWLDRVLARAPWKVQMAVAGSRRLLARL